MLENSLTTIASLYEKFENNDYIISKLEHIINNLEANLLVEQKNHEKRIQRNNELTNEHELFCTIFLNKYKYFYLPYNNCFYEYDSTTYKTIKEDDIHHKLLSTITEEGKLIDWKYKTKTTIIKKIKDRHLFSSVPETYTIQNVLDFLTNTIFLNKNLSKYFLTILGDSLLKKSTTNIYFIHPNSKRFFTLIDNLGYITTGTLLLNNFVTKYHDTHLTKAYRLLKTTENIVSDDILKDYINKYGIDLLCVAAHYSKRYEHAEGFLVSKNDEQINNHIYFFERNSSDDVINTFVSKCIEKNESDLKISWKNMHYIWKLYLNNLGIPNIFYSTTLKDILKLKLSKVYYPEDDCFVNITSKYIPQISSFINFWDTYVSITDSEIDQIYEIDELIMLYKSINGNNYNYNESDIIQIIKHYYSPSVEIIDNKYVTNIECSLWNKQTDLDAFIEYFKGQTKKEEYVTFSEFYEKYTQYAKHINKKLIVSKTFFEKYISTILYKAVHSDNILVTSEI